MGQKSAKKMKKKKKKKRNQIKKDALYLSIINFHYQLKDSKP
jgi:hypothetical protein